MKRNYSLPRSPARTTAQAFFTKRTLGFVQKQLPDRRRDTNKTTLTLTLSRPSGEGTPDPSLAASKAVGYADRRTTILPLPSDGRGPG